MKTAYIITPGIQLPDSFQWRNAPVIHAQPGLWDAMKGMSSGIVFRVRTEQNVGDRLNGTDLIESAVGIVDSTARWRACLAVIRIALSGLRIPEINEACWNVFGMMTNKHPAAIAMQERQTLAGNLRTAMEKLPADDARAAFEGQVAAMCMRLAFAENDVEVAHIVPYGSIYVVNALDQQEDREATVEAVASSIFLSEAFGRLFEKAPEWMFGRLPATPAGPAPTAKPAVEAKKPAQEADDEDDED